MSPDPTNAPTKDSQAHTASELAERRKATAREDGMWCPRCHKYEAVRQAGGQYGWHCRACEHNFNTVHPKAEQGAPPAEAEALPDFVGDTTAVTQCCSGCLHVEGLLRAADERYRELAAASRLDMSGCGAIPMGHASHVAAVLSRHEEESP